MLPNKKNSSFQINYRVKKTIVKFFDFDSEISLFWVNSNRVSSSYATYVCFADAWRLLSCCAAPTHVNPSTHLASASCTCSSKYKEVSPFLLHHVYMCTWLSSSYFPCSYLILKLLLLEFQSNSKQRASIKDKFCAMNLNKNLKLLSTLVAENQNWGKTFPQRLWELWLVAWMGWWCSARKPQQSTLNFLLGFVDLSPGSNYTNK